MDGQRHVALAKNRAGIARVKNWIFEITGNSRLELRNSREFPPGIFGMTDSTEFLGNLNSLGIPEWAGWPYWQYGSSFIRLAVIAPETREMARNSKSIWPYSSSRSSKVIDLGVNRKRICDFLSVTSSNYGRISCRFQDIDAFSSKIACFFNPTLA